MNALLDRYDLTRAAIGAACAEHGREPDKVALLAVSKQQSAAAIRLLAQAGQRDFGENYVQEALGKIKDLQDLTLTWHFIGQLQSNKTRAVAEAFHWVHTVDRTKTAQRLNEQRPHYAPPLQVCIQVKLAEEAPKGGVEPEQVPALAAQIASLPRLRLRGLMCIPPAVEDFDRQYGYFSELARLSASLQQRGLSVDTLSMGMSGDFAAAIAAGSTIVRLGTAIFGARA